MNSEDPSRYTASGYFQITDTNWKAYAPLAGIDTNVFPTAMSDGNYADQAMVALLMYNKFGLMPWKHSQGGFIPDDETAAQLSGVPDAPSAKPKLPASAAHVQAIQHTATASAAHVTSGSHNTQTNNNTVNVTVPRGAHEDGHQLGHKVATAVQRKLAVKQFNTGFD
jgi:hypothetical protein